MLRPMAVLDGTVTLNVPKPLRLLRLPELTISGVFSQVNPRKVKVWFVSDAVRIHVSLRKAANSQISGVETLMRGVTSILGGVVIE